MAADNRIAVSFDDVPEDFTEAMIESRCMRILAVAGIRGRELSVLVCGAARMQELNRDWRGKDRPTDVLSFAQLEGELAGLDCSLLGDVVICHEVLLAQAEEQGTTPDAELTRLLVHGILHLLGFDHEEDPAAAERMRAEEARIINELEGV
jgi:probable rRNA maturation factor